MKFEWREDISQEVRDFWEYRGHKSLKVEDPTGLSLVFQVEASVVKTCPGGFEGVYDVAALLRRSGGNKTARIPLHQKHVEYWVDVAIGCYPGLPPNYVFKKLEYLWNRAPKEATQGIKLRHSISRKAKVLNE